MHFRKILFPFATITSMLVCLAACGSGDGGTGGGGSSTGGGGASTGGGGSSTGGSATGGTGGDTSTGGSTTSAGGSTTTGTGGGGPTVDYCVKACQTAADCASDAGAFDTDNYACDAGACRYLGCSTAAECATSFNNSDYVCGNDPASPVQYCVKKCQAAADCASDAGAFDTDNYTCEGGACRYLGCSADAECATSFNSAEYVCGDDPTFNVKLCTKGCQAAADCASDAGAFDTDNYACEGGACQYLGCSADAECATSFNSSDYVCP